MTSAKDSARAKVRRAIVAGKLDRPGVCESCGQSGPTSSDGRATIHAHHHKGYEFPLDVRWLCPTCHFQEDPRPAREFNGRSVLNEAQIAQIREQYRPGRMGGRWYGASENSQRSLARKFGVSPATIDRIVRNINWIDEALR
jgi:hypothetical protein